MHNASARKSRLPFFNNDLNDLGLLLKPSASSSLIILFSSLVIVFGIFVGLHYNGSSWQQLLAEQQSTAFGSNLTSLEYQVGNNPILSDLPLLIFWASIGVIAYYLIVAASSAFQNVVELEEEMHFVHANRRLLLGRALFHLILRLFFLALWIFYIQFTLHTLMPYIVAMAYAGSGELGWLYNSLYLFGAIALSMICFHLHTVMLRLLLLRARVFA